jgi:hypothetical protein
MSKPSPEEASAYSLAISYELPPDLATKLSEETIAYFNSLTEAEKRRRLKELGYVRSVSATASCELELDQFAVNRQAAQELRIDALQMEIVRILIEQPGLRWKQVVRELSKTPWIELKGDIYRWTELDGRIDTAPYSGIEDRVSRARRYIRSGRHLTEAHVSRAKKYSQLRTSLLRQDS